MAIRIKRLSALVLTIVMLCSMLPTAFAADVLITKQPRNASAYAGERASTTVTATGDGLTYQWYIAAEGSSKFSKSSITKATYGVIMSESNDGRQAYCVVTDQNGNTAKSNTVTLSLRTALAVTKQPKSVTVASGAKATVSIAATGDGLTYAWYYKNAGATKFSKTSSFTGKTYSVAMDASRDGRQVYCVITDKYGSTVKTNTATLSMQHPVKITAQLKSVTVASGETAKVTLQATGDGLTYTWYFKNAGASKFSKTTSFTGNTYSVKMDTTRAGRQVYCIVKDKYGNSVKTNTVTLSMRTALKITKQPQSVSALENERAVTKVEAVGDGLTYQWYLAHPDAPDTFLKSSVTGATYGPLMEEKVDGRRVYCIITDKYGDSVKTNTVTLSMQTALKITQQPKAVAVKNSETAKVTLQATGDGLTYTWYFKNAGASKFSKTTSFTGNTYSVKMDATRAERQVYCIVKDKYGSSVKTNTVTLSMRTALKITKQPQSVSALKNERAVAKVEAVGDGITYQWYLAHPDAPDTFLKSSVTGATYGPLMEEKVDGRRAYCIVTDKYGNAVQSDTIVFSMEKPFRIKLQPENLFVNKSTTEATLTVGVEGGTAPYQYTWHYVSLLNEEEWLYNRKSSESTDSLNVTLNDGSFKEGEGVCCYYCVITDANGMEVASDSVKISRELYVADATLRAYVTSGEEVSMFVKVEGGVKPYTYHWKLEEFSEPWNNEYWDHEIENPSARTDTVSFMYHASDYLFPYAGYEKGYLGGCCVITDAAGNVVVETIPFYPKLVILERPVSVFADVGETVTFSVDIDGGYEREIRWYEHFWDPDGSEKQCVGYTNTLTVTVDEADLSYADYTDEDVVCGYRWFSCHITDAFGQSVQSGIVRILRPVHFYKEPEDVTVSYGETFTYSVEACCGVGPYSYQWQYAEGGWNTEDDWYNLSGSDAQTDTVTLTADDDAYREFRIYRCIVTDAVGNSVSTAIMDPFGASELNP